MPSTKSLKILMFISALLILYVYILLTAITQERAEVIQTNLPGFLVLGLPLIYSSLWLGKQALTEAKNKISIMYCLALIGPSFLVIISAEFSTSVYSYLVDAVVALVVVHSIIFLIVQFLNFLNAYKKRFKSN